MTWIKEDGISSPPQNDNYDCSTYKVPVIYLTHQGYRDLSCAWADVQDGDVLWFCDAKDCEKILYWLSDIPEWLKLK